MTMRELLAKRESIRTELRTLHDGANGGPLAADAQARWTALESEAAALAGLESRQAVIDDLDRRAAGTTVQAGADTRFEELAAQVTFLDNVRAQCGGTDAACGRAREVSAELARRSGRAPEGLLFSLAVSGAPREQRTFTTTNPAGGPGSNLIQTTVSPNLIDRLREKCLVRQMGATVLGGLVGNLAVPRLKASASAQWVAENTGITSTDPQTDQVNLTPKHCGAMYSISRNMIMQPSVDVTRMAEGNIVNLIGSIDSANALNGDTLGFITNAKVVKAARQTLKTSVDTSSNFLITDPNELAGYTLGSTQNVPATFTKGSGTALSALIFGDWSQLLLGFWSELDILVNPYDSTAYAAGGVLIRAMMTCDVEIRHPLAFAALTDLIAP